MGYRPNVFEHVNTSFLVFCEVSLESLDYGVLNHIYIYTVHRVVYHHVSPIPECGCHSKEPLHQNTKF